MNAQPNTATIRRLAVEAEVCPATVRKALTGGYVRGMAGDRITRVLRAHGLHPEQHRQPPHPSEAT